MKELLTGILIVIFMSFPYTPAKSKRRR